MILLHSHQYSTIITYYSFPTSVILLLILDNSITFLIIPTSFYSCCYLRTVLKQLLSNDYSFLYENSELISAVLILFPAVNNCTLMFTMMKWKYLDYYITKMNEITGYMEDKKFKYSFARGDKSLWKSSALMKWDGMNIPCGASA